MASGVQLIGQKRLERSIQRLSNAPKSLDPAYKKTAEQSIRRLKAPGGPSSTPRSEGNTAAAWQGPDKFSNSKYKITNDQKTDDGKHLIINILNDGRREVVPVRAKSLYIPLTSKGKKKTGDPIPPGAVFGVDYVLVKRARAVKGTKFLTNEIKTASMQLTKEVIKSIRSVVGGR